MTEFGIFLDDAKWGVGPDLDEDNPNGYFQPGSEDMGEKPKCLEDILGLEDYPDLMRSGADSDFENDYYV